MVPAGWRWIYATRASAVGGQNISGVKRCAPTKMVKQGKWFSALFFYLFFYQTAAFRLNRRKDLSTVKTRLTLKAQQSVCFFSSPSLELFFLFAHLHEQMALLPKGIGIGGGGGGWGEVVVGRGGGCVTFLLKVARNGCVLQTRMRLPETNELNFIPNFVLLVCCEET